MRRALDIGPILALVAAATLGCFAEPPSPDVLGEPRCQQLRVESPLVDGNLILVLNDTMRRDYPGAYGGKADTPHFDAFGAEHLLFENAVTQAPWTKPSIATLFTSLYPSQHQVASHPQLRRVRSDDRADVPVQADVLAPSLETLAELLQGAGLRTAAFVSNPWMAKSFGFEQGFDVYDDSFARWDATGDEVIEAGLAWLDTLEKGERYFLYLHTIDSHRPYGAISSTDLERERRRLNLGKPLVSRDGRSLSTAVRLDDGTPALKSGFRPTDALIRAAYQSGVERFDVILGRLLQELRARQETWAKTAVIVTSDHGEALFARGYGNHGGGLFDDEAAVPLAARFPGVEPPQGRVSCMVGLVDLMPSLCSYFDLSCPPIVQGWSFLPRTGESTSKERRYLATEGLMNAPGLRSIRNHRFKLVYEPPEDDSPDGPIYALYDLQTDPQEKSDRLAQGYRSAEITNAFETLRASLPAAVAELPSPEWRAAQVDDELRERLEALGYTE
jgi:arylsulfatase A-like enzyme